ncbi:DUF7667 family protein [Paenibacillus phocaensis]|uniref:DUF7667 family protein n=1 Tax=Paenibacillus phocaensis TaxID=1776378 RepID=UPI000839D46B|nr:hypothetical protein [Paenibacillus phocaensis]
MPIMIHPVHRRMAELFRKMQDGTLNVFEASEMMHCLRINTDLVHKIDGYKEAAYAGQVVGNMDLVQHFAAKLDEMEAKYT